VINEKVAERDLTSDNLFEDLLSEKAYELDRVSILISILTNYDINSIPIVYPSQDNAPGRTD